MDSPVCQKGVDGLGNHLAFADLRAGRTYYWRVKVKTATGQWTAFSEPTSFIVTAGESSFSLFRDGYKNYEGARDVDIRGNGKDHSTAIREWNQGNQDVLRTGRRGTDMPTDEVYRSLLRFNISILKDAGAVLSAYLILTGWEHDQKDPCIDIQAVNELYAIRKPWGEGDGLIKKTLDKGDASWTYSQYPKRWKSPGLSKGEDYGRDSLGKLKVISHVGAKAVFFSSGFISLVKQWIRTPHTNYGVLMIADDESRRETMNIASREHPEPSFRPALVLISREDSPYATDRAACHPHPWQCRR